ncbi:MAG: aspartate/glutamate racemase family protein [Gemmatimonadetes bacterium]|nr:aspartate/glutamate racemase family protein [Gemmatimonadota bacterium]
MKIIGLLGGMSWESTVEYYRLINEEVKLRLGGLHSARIALYSVDFEEIEKLQHADRWAEAADLMIEAALRVERAGADFLLICTNTMHKLADQVADAINIPLLHIADATAATILSAGSSKIGLLGTRFTMEEDFYRGRLEKHHDLEVLIPGADDRRLVHDVIYDELCLGTIREESRLAYTRIIDRLVSQGAQGVILGCTEISLLVKPEHATCPLFDTTRIHAIRAVDRALTD